MAVKVISFFNNKGGVGKTTLACNIAAYFGSRLHQRVLLVDCDPQCNSTQLILPQATCEDIYQIERTGRPTILDVMQPIRDGDSNINAEVVPQLGSENRFRIDLMPGHPAMSAVEDKLGEAWAKLRASDVGGFRVTNWCVSFADAFAERYNLIIFDLGPSLGPINRSVLLGSDYFVTPMGCDIFSIVGIQNIGSWLGHWTTEYGRTLSFFEGQHADAIAKYRIRRSLPVARGFAGYTVLQYITKSLSGERRATKAFDEILNRVPEEIKNNLGPYFADGVTMQNARLGDVPNMFSLVPLAQSANAPIRDLESRDGLAGGQFKQQESYSKFIENVAKALADNVSLGKQP